MAGFLEDMMLRMLLNLPEEIGYDYGSRDSVTKKYTNKDFVVNHQEECLAPFETLLPDDAIVFTMLTRTATTGYRSSGPSVKLHPKNRVNIATLSQNVDTTMKGKFFLCRCITPSHKMTSIMTVVDDPEGEHAVRLALYNYTNSKSDLDLILPVGLILAILNPWFKPTVDGGLTVRCDSPGDVIVISPTTLQTDFPSLNWNGEIPSKYRMQAILPDPTVTVTVTTRSHENPSHAAATEFKNLGNKAFVNKEFADAIRFYSQSLELLPNYVDSLSNRSAAFTNLGCYNKGLQDATAVLKMESEHVKGIYRSVKSLRGLNRYNESVDFLSSKFTQNRNLKKDTNLKHLWKQSNDFLRQHQTGQYDMVEILQGNGQCIEVAEFTGPVEIREIPGKGRGLISTKTVKAGQLLICSKAFAFYQPNESEPMINISVNYETRKLNSPFHDQVVGLIAQKLSLEPELTPEVYKLFAGSELGFIEEETNGQVDMKRIDKIVTFNRFSTIKDGNKIENTGLWILPSYINHSCIDSNSYGAIYNDTMLIRAIKPITEGEEILFPYVDPASPFEERQVCFQSHAFECGCYLCATQLNEHEDNRTTCRGILESLQNMGKINPSQVHQVLHDLQNLYSTLNYPILNLCLSSPTFINISQQLFEMEMYKECIKLLEKIRFVTKDTAKPRDAAGASINILRSYLLLATSNQRNKRSLIDTWIGNVKHDLLVAYGTLEAMNVFGKDTLSVLQRNGISFFDK